MIIISTELGPTAEPAGNCQKLLSCLVADFIDRLAGSIPQMAAHKEASMTAVQERLRAEQQRLNRSEKVKGIEFYREQFAPFSACYEAVA